MHSIMIAPLMQKIDRMAFWTQNVQHTWIRQLEIVCSRVALSEKSFFLAAIETIALWKNDIYFVASIKCIMHSRVYIGLYVVCWASEQKIPLLLLLLMHYYRRRGSRGLTEYVEDPDLSSHDGHTHNFMLSWETL